MDNNTQQFGQPQMGQQPQASAPLMPEPIADGSLGQSGATPFSPTPDTTPANQSYSAAPSQPTQDFQVDNGNSATDDIGAIYAAQQSSTLNDAAEPIATPSQSDDNQEPPSELLDIKQKALEELSPLVNELEQSPEDKFRTLMMLIQTSDNQSLVPEAYKAAQSITDEKSRAQALLDVVNEINYFTNKK